MFAFALAVGISLFFAGLVAIGWAVITCVKEMFGCLGSDDDNDEDDILDEDDITSDDE